MIRVLGAAPYCGDPCPRCGRMVVVEARAGRPRHCTECDVNLPDPALALAEPDSDFAARRRAGRGEHAPAEGPAPAAPEPARSGTAAAVAEAVVAACEVIGAARPVGYDGVEVRVDDEVYAQLVARYHASTSYMPTTAGPGSVTTLHGVRIARLPSAP